jgi:tetratricopeptide (TPR) repeat protein
MKNMHLRFKHVHTLGLRFAAVMLLHSVVASAQVKPVAQDISITSKSPQAVERFKNGRDLVDNVRITEATAEFKQALGLDPDFALAHAYLGSITPGAEGTKALERAAALAAKLPEAERLLVEYYVAEGRGDEEKSRTVLKQLSEVAPGDWHVNFYLGSRLSNERKWNDAVAALTRATELNPKAGPAYNILGYTYLGQDKNNEAVQAFKKYVEIQSGEANSHDSLAEALMAAGRLEEAEAEFRKAVQINPQLFFAWLGVAQTKFLRDDWAGGYQALDSAKSAATRAFDKLDVDETRSWSQFAQGKKDEASKTLDTMEKEAAAQKEGVFVAFVPLLRARMSLEAGKPDAALQQVALGLQKAESATLSGDEKNAARRSALTTRIAAEARLGKTADAQKTLALIETEAKNSPSNAEVQAMLHFGQGQVALVQGDAKTAVKHLSLCPEQNSYFRLQLALAQVKAGDAAGAGETRRKIVEVNRRSPSYLYVREQVVAADPSLSTRR